MPKLRHDDLDFHYRDAGSGVPFVFQHGLGGDLNQPFGIFKPPHGFRMLAFDCRAHGQTFPLGDEHKICLPAFADDLLALLDAWHLERIVVGGISMGAAVALNFAARFPDRIMGLVLSRPAWLDGPNQTNVRLYALIADLIREHGARRGRELFQETSMYQEVLKESSDCAASLLGQFWNPRAEETIVKFHRILGGAPTRDLAELKSIRVPTLVLANRQDPIHPFEYGEVLARTIPGAEFHELTPKSLNPTAHMNDVQRLISDFFQRHFGT
jgi:pimeloyl-ACP methyl ester carboxylesterase